MGKHLFFSFNRNIILISLYLHLRRFSRYISLNYKYIQGGFYFEFKSEKDKKVK